MKKMISLVLCALMAASLCLTAFAVDAPGSEGGIQPQNHIHSWIEDGTVNGGYTYHDELFCSIPVYNRYTCTCGAVTIGSAPIGYKFPIPHKGPPYAASCDGGTQTWRCTCNTCGGHYIETWPCLGKDHKNGCSALPVSLDTITVMW